MANPDPIPLLKKPQVAALLGVNENTITKFERGGLPIATPGGRGTATLYNAPAVVAWYVTRRVAEVAGESPGALNKEQQQARRDKAQADLNEFRLAALRGEMIPRTDFQSVLGKVVHVIKARLLAGPRAWAPALTKAATEHGPGGVEQALTQRVREILEALAVIDVDKEAS